MSILDEYPKKGEYIQAPETSDNPNDDFAYVDKWIYAHGAGIYEVCDHNGVFWMVHRDRGLGMNNQRVWTGDKQ
jgi:hypothetical protein